MSPGQALPPDANESAKLSEILNRAYLLYERQRYYIDYDLIRSLFEKFPQNQDRDVVYAKVDTLDRVYSTQLYRRKTKAGRRARYAMAGHIVSSGIDGLLESGSVVAVKAIRSGHGILANGKEIDLYSFATKYCHLHKPESYPIFDSNVKKALSWLRRTFPLAVGQHDKNRGDFDKDYDVLHETIDVVRSFLGGEDYHKIDAALYLLGGRLPTAGVKSISPDLETSDWEL